MTDDTAWKPISSAPTDGTHVILRINGGIPWVGRFHRLQRFVNGVLAFESEYWTNPFRMVLKDAPTHWMALPEYSETGTSA